MLNALVVGAAFIAAKMPLVDGLFAVVTFTRVSHLRHWPVSQSESPRV